MFEKVERRVKKFRRASRVNDNYLSPPTIHDTFTWRPFQVPIEKY